MTVMSYHQMVRKNFYNNYIIITLCQQGETLPTKK